MENWKDIPGYEGRYQVSDLGRVKSLKRVASSKRHNNHGLTVPEKILKPYMRGEYLTVALSANNKRDFHSVHRLVLYAFEGISNLFVDHRNKIKTDNRLLNLRYCTFRENISWARLDLPKTSRYTGVSLIRKTGKWRAGIKINGIVKNLGHFINEVDAHHAYQSALKQSLNG